MTWQVVVLILGAWYGFVALFAVQIYVGGTYENAADSEN